MIDFFIFWHLDYVLGAILSGTACYIGNKIVIFSKAKNRKIEKIPFRKILRIRTKFLNDNAIKTKYSYKI